MARKRSHRLPEQGGCPEDRRRQTGFKLVLVLTPFVAVLLLGLIEWWLRSRGP